MLLAAMENVRAVHEFSTKEKGSFQFGKYLIVENRG